MPPVSSPRSVYQIPDLVRSGSASDGAAVLAPGFIKMKDSHAKLLGIQDLELDPAALKTTVTRADGTQYTVYTNKGGFRTASYELLPYNNSTFDVEEVTGKNADGTDIIQFQTVKSISIGLPAKISKTRFLDWLASVAPKAILQSVRTPAGIKYPIPYPPA